MQSAGGICLRHGLGMSMSWARSGIHAGKMFAAAPNMYPPAHHIPTGEQHAVIYMGGDPPAPPHLLDTGPAAPNGSTGKPSSPSYEPRPHLRPAHPPFSPSPSSPLPAPEKRLKPFMNPFELDALFSAAQSYPVGGGFWLNTIRIKIRKTGVIVSHNVKLFHYVLRSKLQLHHSTNSGALLELIVPYLQTYGDVWETLGRPFWSKVPHILLSDYSIF